MPRSHIFCLLLMLLLSACLPKKYGRYFNNTTKQSSWTSHAKSLEKEPELIASSDNSLIKPLAKEMSTSVTDYSSQIKKRTLVEDVDKTHRVKPKTYTKQKERKPHKRAKTRKIEPIGMGSFGLFVITSLMGISTGFTPLPFVLLGLLIIGGAISIHKIASNKQKWRGRFFGNFVIIMGVLLLALLGIDALIQSVFGNS